MDSPPVTWVFWLVVVGLVSGEMGGVKATKSCGFPAIFNFGDSNSDTGGKAASEGGVPSPHGVTFFGKPAGRVCDGRLIIDFIAENLKMPYLNGYLDSVGANFRHGANFATAGSSVLEGGFSPYHLDIQIAQFIHFKSRSTYLQTTKKSRTNNGEDVPPCKNSLPQPEDFSKALYTFDIGQNDLAQRLKNGTEATQAAIPGILDMYTKAIHQLYKEGARFFWIHNTGPIGCLPNNAASAIPKIKDQNGCVKPMNEVAEEFNRQLKDRVSQLRATLSDAKFTYVDVYSAKYALFSNAKNLGFDDTLKFCCGSVSVGYVQCGQTKIVDGIVHGKCTDPSKYIIWDGIHYSEAANLLLSKQIINGSVSDPPVSVAKACQILP